MRVLLDTNIILDFFLLRAPFYDAASQIFDAIADGKIVGFISASSVTDIFYICRRQTQSVEVARNIIQSTLSVLSVCLVNDVVLQMALQSSMSDFEDAVQVACAQSQGLDVIVTRNGSDFIRSGVLVLTPSELLKSI